METIRLCLKHFRQRNMMDVFYLIQNRTGVDLENPFLTELHKHLVLGADFPAAEHVLEAAHSRHIFKEYAAHAEYTPIWKRIWATNEGIYYYDIAFLFCFVLFSLSVVCLFFSL